MTQEWDVNNVKWPSRWPWAMTAALVVGIVAFVGAGVWQYKRAWTPFERLYFAVYAQTYRPSLSLFQQPTASFNLLYRMDAKGRRLATSKDLGDVVDHKARLEWGWEEYNKLELRTWLRSAFYGGRSPWEKFADSWWLGALVFGLCMLWAVPLDSERWRPLRKGLRLRGPEMVTTSVFNKRNRSTGIGFVNLLRVWWDALLFPNKIPMVRIPLGAGVTSRTLLVPILPDSLHEGDETVLLSLAGPTSGATLGPTSNATLTIVDDDQSAPGPAIAKSMRRASRCSALRSVGKDRPVRLEYDVL